MVENENKFVLKQGWFDFDGWDCHHIEQHYLPGDIRIRQDKQYDDVEYTINTKSLRDDGAHNELEYSIDSDVYGLLVRQSLRAITKIRYAKHIGDENWSVDFMLPLHALGEVYFVLGECEMPEGRTAPLYIPPQVINNLILAVPRNESFMYSNYRLADITYAKKLMKGLTNGS